MPIEVRITATALQQLNDLHEPILARVNGLIERLSGWPSVSGTKALRGSLKGHFRLRTGDWRIIFSVKGNIVTISAISNRKDVYED